MLALLFLFLFNISYASENEQIFEMQAQQSSAPVYLAYDSTEKQIIYTETHSAGTTFETLLEILKTQAAIKNSSQPIILSIDMDYITPDDFNNLEQVLIEKSIKHITLLPVSSHSQNLNPEQLQTQIQTQSQAQTSPQPASTKQVSANIKEPSLINSMSVGVALIKSAIGTTYYFHYLPFEPALLGSIFSSVHNLIFTANPIAEQKFLLNPLKNIFGFAEPNSRKAQHFDLMVSTIHKLLNLGIVSTIINWEHLNAAAVIYDAGVTAVVYTLIKNFWKIHFDYQLKLKNMSEKSYQYVIPTLDLVSYGIMPGIMLNEPWAVTIGSVLGATGMMMYIFNPKFIKTIFTKKIKIKCSSLLLGGF